MIDFEYYSPTRIIFGKGKEEETGKLLKQYADSALVVCSKGNTNKSGVVDRVLASLKAEGIRYMELTGIKPNPMLSKVYEGIELVRANDLKFVLAVGGGSIIDTAKAIAVGALYDGDVWDFFTGTKVEKSLQVGVVLTIPAAGSEMSNNSIITKDNTIKKLGFVSPLVIPVFAVENPALTLTLDKWQTFCGIADMMMHVLERYISRTKNVDFSDRISEALLRCEIDNANILLGDPNNYEARAEIMLASSFSHNNINGIGRETEWVSHGLGKSLSGMYDCTHGATLTPIVCSWMRYIVDDATEMLAKFANRVFDVPCNFDDPKQTALEGINRLENQFKKMGVPTTLKELGVPTDDAALRRVAEDYCSNGVRGVIRRIDVEDALKILYMARG
jgi:alcohol dehydrogenase YqhD (iron-dependent ADH family)